MKPDYDAVIIGGGIIGSATAYYLKRLEPQMRVTVVERDPTYERASTPLCFGVFRVQFSFKENILMSLKGHEALATFSEDMAVDGQSPELTFKRDGYLFLYPSQAAETAAEILALQHAEGCHTEWLTPGQIKERIPGLNPAGLAGGIMSLEDGHLDPYSFLMAYRAKAIDLGVNYLTAEAVGLSAKSGRVDGAVLSDGKTIPGRVVIAGGAWSMDLTRQLGLELPVKPVMRQVFAFEPADGPDRPLPFITAPSGVYLRSETGGLLLIGCHTDEDPVGFKFGWDRKRFEDIVWPKLAELFPSLDRGRLIRGWSGVIDHNDLDGNPILGRVPDLPGIFLAFGFSGHGLMHASAAGRYIAEVMTGRELSLDLSAFGLERITNNQPIREKGAF